MKRRWLFNFFLLAFYSSAAACGRSTLPSVLSDAEFWRLATEMSEPAGAFTHSDNLVSNEIHFVHMLRMLRPAGGVYVGVGPEQNFSYLARIQPEMAFIVDIRRENRNLHLLYKALFELSTDRADFLSRLFSRARPAGVGPETPVVDLFARYASLRAERALFDANGAAIRDRLVRARGFPLSEQDLASIEYARAAFYADGPDIHYGRSRPDDAPGPGYRALMTAPDVRGEHRTYLASEQAFAFVRGLHAKNLIVPLVGNFAGPTTIRRVSDYVRSHGASVSAFYSSNVEVYLNREGVAAFCGNLLALPSASRTWFIGSKRMIPMVAKLKSCQAPAS